MQLISKTILFRYAAYSCFNCFLALYAFATVALAVDQKECESYKGDDAEYCFSALGCATGDLAACNRSGQYMDLCYPNAAQVKKDPSVCEKIPDGKEQYAYIARITRSEACYHTYAGLTHEIEICDKIKDNDFRIKCRMNSRGAHKEDCNKIQDADFKKECLGWAEHDNSIPGGGPSIIEMDRYSLWNCPEGKRKNCARSGAPEAH